MRLMLASPARRKPPDGTRMSCRQLSEANRCPCTATLRKQRHRRCGVRHQATYFGIGWDLVLSPPLVSIIICAMALGIFSSVAHGCNGASVHVDFAVFTKHTSEASESPLIAPPHHEASQI